MLKPNPTRKDKKQQKRILAKLLEIAHFRSKPHNDRNVLFYGIKKTIEEIPVVFSETSVTVLHTVQLDSKFFPPEQRYSYLRTYLITPDRGFSYEDISRIISEVN